MKPSSTYQKLRGGYYTPQTIADFLADWAIQKPTDKVIEPSCGDGNLLIAALNSLAKHGATKAESLSNICGIENDEQEAQKAKERLKELTKSSDIAEPQILTGDFFKYCRNFLETNQSFDAVIGNPPFIRYQNFPEDHRITAFYLMQVAGLHPSRLTNSWVPFLVASTLLLKENGRLAMVIPAELLQVNYAAELRYFLSKYYNYITLITFKKLVFEGIQQEIVLLLAEKGNSSHDYTGINTIELDGMDDLLSYEHSALLGGNQKEMDHSSEKWTMYFLEQEEIELLRALKINPNLTLARDVIDVDVGIVTGLNEFFVLSKDQVENFSLSKYTKPIVGRSANLPGLIFSESDWTNNVQKQAPSFLLNLPDLPFYSLPAELQSYVANGEERGVNTGYKCKIRNRWYIVPSVWVPNAFMLRQIHSYPKIIVNDADATCTDTIHRIKLRNGTPAKTIAAAFLNSLTFAFTEITGRSYGGGVLELEPNEAEKLPIPLVGANLLDLEQLDSLLRSGNIENVLEITDRVLLKEGLGLTSKEIKTLHNIWIKLRDRRINRKPDSTKNNLCFSNSVTNNQNIR